MLCDVCRGKRENRELKRKQDETTGERSAEMNKRKGYQNQVRMKEMGVRQKEATWKEIKRAVNQSGNGCVVCWFEGRDYAAHGSGKCPRWKAGISRTSLAINLG